MVVSFGLWIVRHGETVSNKACIIQGQLDSPLNENGRLQAKRAGKAFDNITFSHAFSSDLSRTEETCRLILASKHNKQDSLAITLDERLREKRYGILEGQPSEKLHELAKKARVSPHRFEPEGGETLNEVYSRVKSAFLDICSEVCRYGVDRHAEAESRTRCCAASNQESHCPELAKQPVHVEDDTLIPPASSTHPSIEIFDESGGEVVTGENGVTPGETTCARGKPNTNSSNVGATPMNVNALDLNLPNAAGSRNYSSVSITSDDSSIPDQLDANVLVVSHGGAIRETFRYFMEDLDCVFPGGRATALRVIANTAISHFIVTVDPLPPCARGGSGVVSPPPPPSPVVVDPYMQDCLIGAPDDANIIASPQINIICLYSHSKDHLLVESAKLVDQSEERVKSRDTIGDLLPGDPCLVQPVFMASEQV